MGKNKTSKAVASKVSSSANPAASSTTENRAQSSILRSSFSPSVLQLSLFASVIQSFDSQHLRIHDTTTGRLRCEHALTSRASITCLDWGYYGGGHGERHSEGHKKKRKRTDLLNGNVSNLDTGDATIAFGTSDSKICLFSPAESKVLKVLDGAHAHGIRDFKFREAGLQAEGWSIGGDAKLVQWDLKKGLAIRTVTLPHGPAQTLRPLNSLIIYASQNAYIWDSSTRDQPLTFAASTNLVHSIIESKSQSSQASTFLTAAESDRYINVFSTDSRTLIGSLRTENEVLALDAFSNVTQPNATGKVTEVSLNKLPPHEVLLVVNKDGALELFPEPFDFGSHAWSKEVKSVKARMQKRSRQRDALVRVIRPDKTSSLVPLANASFQGDYIAMVWVEGGINPVFEKIKWRDESNGNLVLSEVTEIIKTKSGPGVEANVMNGVKDMGKSHVSEAHTVVTNGAAADDVSMADEPPEIIEISSEVDSESEDESPAGLLEEGNARQGSDREAIGEDVAMKDVETLEAADLGSDSRQDHLEQAEEPSFGDLIKASASEPVDVQAAFTDPNAQSLVPSGDRSLQQPHSGMSLATVLTQSLRTNDNELLETCFHEKDFTIVRATIERLNSSFAATLLQRLVERLHSRPGRAGSLMVWIQWTFVAHGGYLAGQANVLRKVASLQGVIKERSNSLPALLRLKGKLDMMEAQGNFKKSMQARSREANALDDDDEEGVIYVEGQKESDSEESQDEEAVTPMSRPSMGKRPIQKSAADHASDSGTSDADSQDEEDSEDEMPTTNGAIAESEDDDSGSEEDGLIDDEASSTENDSVNGLLDDEVDHESVDSADSSDADASPPPKRPAKLSNGIGPRRR